MTKYYISIDKTPYHNIKVEAIEERYNCKYLGTWQYRDYDFPLDIFHIKKPTTVNGRLAEKYVGVFLDRRIECMPVDDVFDEMIVGVESNNGEVCVSRYLDHHYISHDRTTWIEGGRTFISTNKPDEDRLVRVYVVDGQFEFEPIGSLQVEKHVDKLNSFFQIFKWP